MQTPLFAILACVLVIPAHAEAPAGYDFVDYDTGLRRAQVENKPVLLYFGRYGCAWCDHTNRKTFTDPEIKAIYQTHYSLVYVDAEGGKRLRLPSGERITEAELGARLGAYATPLFVFLTPQGKLIAKIPGYKTVQDFKDYDRYVRGGHHERQSLLEFLGNRP